VTVQIITTECNISKFKRSLNSGNACHHLVQNLSSSRLLSKLVKIRIYRTIVLPIVLYWCKTWPLILSQERRMWVFKNRVLRRIFEPKR
jgi:hypothetical protein